MPRPLRPRLADIPLHVMQRGVDRNVCFREPRDFSMYLELLEEFAEARRCAVHAYVLMTNHVHLLITPSHEDACSSLMKDVAQRYSQRCNRNWKRSGPLWDGRFKSNVVDTDRYFLTCQRYIEMNPVRARMVGHPREYPWSSFRANADGARWPLICPHRVFRAMARDEGECRTAYRALFELPENPRELKAIRDALTGGFPLGSATFIARVEQLTGRRMGRRRRRSVRTSTVQQGV